MDNLKLVMIKKLKIPRKNKIKKYKFNQNQNLKLMINQLFLIKLVINLLKN